MNWIKRNSSTLNLLEKASQKKQPILSSNIVDLIQYAVKKRDPTLHGWQEFESVLWQPM